MNTHDQQGADCFICRKHRGEIVLPGGVIYEDDLVSAGHLHHDEGSTYLGYLVAETKRHVPELADLIDEEAQAMGLLLIRLSRALRDSEGAEHVYVFLIGHAVPHVHLQIVPRYPGTPRDYWGTRVNEWPDAPRGGAAEIAVLCDRLRTFLENEHHPA